MIKLDVKDYCHGCVHFECSVRNPDVCYADGMKIAISDSNIQCEYKDICDYVRERTLTEAKLENILEKDPHAFDRVNPISASELKAVLQRNNEIEG